MITVKQLGKDSWVVAKDGHKLMLSGIKELDDLIVALTHQSQAWWDVNAPQEPLSDCCTASITFTDICTACKEHCTPMTQADIDAEMARDDWRKKKED